MIRINLTTSRLEEIENKNDPFWPNFVFGHTMVYFKKSLIVFGGSGVIESTTL